MNKTPKILLALCLLGGGGAALAATSEKLTMADCDALIAQFDGEVTRHEDAKKVKHAKDMRAKAETECKAGDFKKGVSKLHVALKDIGVTPAAK